MQRKLDKNLGSIPFKNFKNFIIWQIFSKVLSQIVFDKITKQIKDNVTENYKFYAKS